VLYCEGASVEHLPCKRNECTPQIPLKPEWNLPAGVPEMARQPGWHEYRLEFLREVRSREAFDRQLAEMRRELDEALMKG